MSMLQVSEGFVREAYAEACASWKTKIETAFPSLFRVYKTGQKLKLVDSYRPNDIYIIASVGPDNRLVLIDIASGARWNDGVIPATRGQLTQAEMGKLTSDRIFELV